MHLIDLSIIIVFLVGLISFGIIQGRKNSSIEDYFLGGRDLSWLTAMFSIVATETSVLTFISIPGLAYTKDWFFLQLAFGYIIGRIFVSIFMLPVYFKDGVISIYEVIGQRFGVMMQRFSSFIFLVTRVLADGIRFLATAVIVQVITGWSIPVSVMIVGFVTIIYSLSGGIKTIILIDSFQFVLYIVGGLLSIGYILYLSDQSFFEYLAPAIEQGKLNVFNFDSNIFTNPWSAFSAIFGGILLSFSSHGIDYMMVQRSLSCRSLGDAKKAMLGSGIVVFIQFTVFLLVGTFLYLYYNGIEIQKDREFATYIVNVLPVGIKGILLAGVLSAAMSTLSSSINSLASSTLIDWFKKSDNLRLSKLFSFIWAIVLIGIALIFDEGDKAIVIVGLQIASFTYGALLGLFILSRMDRDFHPVSLIEGLIMSIGFTLLLKQTGLAWTFFIASGVIINIVTVFAVDWLIKKMQRL